MKRTILIFMCLLLITGLFVSTNNADNESNLLAYRVYGSYVYGHYYGPVVVYPRHRVYGCVAVPPPVVIVN